jgi:hypothetical protein
MGIKNNPIPCVGYKNIKANTIADTAPEAPKLL